MHNMPRSKIARAYNIFLDTYVRAQVLSHNVRTNILRMINVLVNLKYTDHRCT